MDADATSPLRVLYSFPHPVGGPGIGTTAANQVRALAEQGAAVTLVCTSLHTPVPATVQVRETLRIRGRRVPHRAFGSPDLALAFHDRRVASLLSRHQVAAEVVHTWPQSALATIRAAARTGVLSSREVPNTHTENAYAEAAQEARNVGLDMNRRNSHRPDARRLAVEEREYAEVDILLVPSANVAQTFLDRGVEPGRLRRHQYGYDPIRFFPAEGSEHAGRPFTAAFVGRAEPRKGLHHALQAWQAAGLPAGSQLIVAGSFVPGYRERLGSALDAPGVNVLGFVDDVPALLRGCDVLLLPSVEEGSALVTYEAQASGCVPLVSSAAGALLPPGVQPFVHAPRDVAVLASHLSSLALDPSRLASLRQEVIAWSAGLTWSAAGQRMLEIYNSELLSRRG